MLSGQVWIVDPRGAKVTPVEAGEPQSGRDLKLSVLRAGETYEASAR